MHNGIQNKLILRFAVFIRVYNVGLVVGVRRHVVRVEGNVYSGLKV